MNFYLHDDAPAIVLRDKKEDKKKKGKELPVPQTQIVRDMEKLVRRYRRFLRAYEISAPDEAFEHLEQDLPDDVHIRRIFNDGQMNKGGRFYGAWWQQIPSEFRNKITIDGEKTVELDFQGQTICHLYAREGMNFSKDIGGDPYDLDGIPRKLTKLICVVILNTKTDHTTWRAITARFEKEVSVGQDILKHTTEYHDFKKVLAKLREKHKKIFQYFHQMVALDIQFEDSEICASVIRYLLDKKIPVLTIHDSFLVKEGARAELEEAMKQAYLSRRDHLKNGLPKIEDK